MMHVILVLNFGISKIKKLKGNCLIKLMNNHMSYEHIKNGIDNNEFYLLYQPIVLHDGSIYGVEALARWRTGNSVITPEKFIGVLEEIDHLFHLTIKVIEIITKDFSGVDFNENKVFYLSLNVSASCITNNSVVEALIKLKKTLTPNITLILELNEKYCGRHIHDVVESINVIRQHGFKLALDDFGTGYNNLSSIFYLNPDIIKIDKAFVSLIYIHGLVFSILECLIKMAKKLNIEIIVEGVEFEYQVEFLRLNDVVLFQGFFFSRPISIWNLLKKI